MNQSHEMCKRNKYLKKKFTEKLSDKQLFDPNVLDGIFGFIENEESANFYLKLVRPWGAVDYFKSSHIIILRELFYNKNGRKMYEREDFPYQEDTLIYFSTPYEYGVYSFKNRKTQFYRVQRKRESVYSQAFFDTHFKNIKIEPSHCLFDARVKPSEAYEDVDEYWRTSYYPYPK